MRLGKWLLYSIVAGVCFYGGALLSLRVPSDATPSISTDASTTVPVDRAAGPPPGYRPPAPEDTPCLQRANVARCIGRATARTGLMTLAGLQAERIREHGAYGEDAATLGFRPESGMELRLRADRNGWTAEYHHVTARVGCAIYEGQVAEPFATVDGGVPDVPGAVACDDPLAGGR